MAVFAIIQNRPTYPELANYPIAKASLQPITSIGRVWTAIDVITLDNEFDNVLLAIVKLFTYILLTPFVILSAIPATLGWATISYVNRN